LGLSTAESEIARSTTRHT